MIELLKRFGLGILYVLLSPFFVFILALFLVYGLVLFLFMAFKACFLFFTGRSVFDDMREDVEAKKRLGQIINHSINHSANATQEERKESNDSDRKTAKPVLPQKDGDVK